MFEFKQVNYKGIIDIPELRIRKGLTAFLGPSSSGKTTVLRLLNKMISPTAGSILYEGKELAQTESVAHRRNVMMLSQAPVMFEGSIRDNLLAGFRLQEREVPADEALLGSLEKVQLNKTLDTPVNQLSGGERQRLALARVILCNPAVFILDEPSAALDDETEDIIISMVAAHARAAGRSIVLVTHSKGVAEKYADEILEMAGGKIIRRRTPT